jgi:hypothetical protein
MMTRDCGSSVNEDITPPTFLYQPRRPDPAPDSGVNAAKHCQQIV